MQAVPNLTANGMKSTCIKAGEEVEFVVKAEVPEGAGVLASVEWSFEGETEFIKEGEWELSSNGRCGIARATHTYVKEGTYFAVVRIASERNGRAEEIFTQILNIDRARVIVE